MTMGDKEVTKTHRRKRSNPDESKRDRFVRLAESRTEAVRDKLRILGNLSNTRFYDFNPDDISKIFDAIEDDVRRARGKFNSAIRASGEFSLSKGSK